MLLVFLALNYLGNLLFPLYSALTAALLFSVITVKCLAIDLRTVLILQILEAAPPATLATLN